VEYTEEIPRDGNVCVVCTRIFGTDALWDAIPDSMADAVIMFNPVMKQVSFN
jgi:hypothetical protein